MSEQSLGTEIFRLCKIAKEHFGDALLAEALAGRERTVDNVAKLFGFISKNVGQDSGIADKFWTVISDFLQESGVDQKQLKKIRYPYLRPGEKGFSSILDEMRDEGWDI